MSQILDSSDPSRFSTSTLSHGENRMLGARLGRLQQVGETIEGVMLVRSLVQRLQVAAAELTGCIFNDVHLQEAEFQGAVFRYCHFKKVRIENASFRQARFESCTFEDCQITPSMEMSDTDGVHFENCYIHDAGEHFTKLLKSKAWTFHRCVVASPAALEIEGNTFLPLLAFTPPAVPPTVAPVLKPTAEAKGPLPEAPSKPKETPQETPKAGANRFDQLELG